MSRKLLLCVVICAAMALAAYIGIQTARAWYVDSQFAQIRTATAALRPGLSARNGLSTAVALRDLIHNGPAVAAPRFSYLAWWSPAEVYNSSLSRQPGYGQSCGGLTRLYLLALAAHEIPARKVALYATVKDAPAPFRADLLPDFWTGFDWRIPLE